MEITEYIKEADRIESEAAHALIAALGECIAELQALCNA